MAHVRPVPDGYEVGLDEDEHRRAALDPRVGQRTLAISRVYDSEEGANAFLEGYNAGARAFDEAVASAIERLRLAGDEFVAVDGLGELFDCPVRLREAVH